MPGPRLPRRRLLTAALLAPRLPAAPVEIPVLRLLDKHTAASAADIQRFSATIWDEAARAFHSCGVVLRTTARTEEIRRYPSGRPQFLGLQRNSLNVVLTHVVPLYWDSGRSLSGVTTIYEGYHLSVIALRNAYANRLPLLAVNTVVHELLHAFLGDIFTRQSAPWHGADREAAVDWQATRLWLTGHAPHIQQQARVYALRLAQNR
jgi:hypothetical protein